MTDVAAWAEDHKPVVIGGAAGLVLLLLVLRHRAKANAASSTAGPTAQDTGGQYLVPYDSTASGADSGSSGTDLSGLVDAITGLTTSVNNLDPATGPTNNGTDGGGGHDLGGVTPGLPAASPIKAGGGSGVPTLHPLPAGHPVHRKPHPVHKAKHPHPPQPTHRKKHTPPPPNRRPSGHRSSSHPVHLRKQ